MVGKRQAEVQIYCQISVFLPSTMQTPQWESRVKALVRPLCVCVCVCDLEEHPPFSGLLPPPLYGMELGDGMHGSTSGLVAVDRRGAE